MNDKKKRAVIVEDSAQMRGLIHMALNATGIGDIIEAENGAVAIDLIKSWGADIVIMDWVMDVMDGMECTRRIRAGIDGIDPQTPIILLTGQASKDSEAAAYAAGADLFMEKPFSLKQLHAGIVRAINGRKGELQSA
ncbi:MAG TPA: response regulator [Rhodospirillaceae bacterium]|nr:response regulator [Rhodospirillaceae bacterium]